MLFLKMFGRKWLLATLLAIVAAGVCARLGVWQLDRLAQRRVFNAQVEAMRSAAPLDLNQRVPEDIASMEWRNATVRGTYDFGNQLAIRNQFLDSQYGYHLITPLLFQGMSVLVDRGWIPPDDTNWQTYDQGGIVRIAGQIRLGAGKPAFGGVADTVPADGSKLRQWNNFDLEHMAPQFPYRILKIYLQLNVDPTDTTPPIPYQPIIDLTEGPHFGYALQWFSFAILILVGYTLYVRKQEKYK